jgi:hypothetical protein
MRLHLKASDSLGLCSATFDVSVIELHLRILHLMTFDVSVIQNPREPKHYCMCLWVGIAESTKTTEPLVGWRITRRAEPTKTVPIGGFYRGSPRWSRQGSTKHSEDPARKFGFGVSGCIIFCLKNMCLD